jgi:hypothetical protein
LYATYVSQDAFSFCAKPGEEGAHIVGERREGKGREGKGREGVGPTSLDGRFHPPYLRIASFSFPPLILSSSKVSLRCGKYNGMVTTTTQSYLTSNSS